MVNIITFWGEGRNFRGQGIGKRGGPSIREPPSRATRSKELQRKSQKICFGRKNKTQAKIGPRNPPRSWEKEKKWARGRRHQVWPPGGGGVGGGDKKKKGGGASTWEKKVIFLRKGLVEEGRKLQRGKKVFSTCEKGKNSKNREVLKDIERDREEGGSSLEAQLHSAKKRAKGSDTKGSRPKEGEGGK